MIRQAEFEGDLEAVVTLWRAYLDWANDELERRVGFRLSTDDFIADDLATIDKYAPPDGRLLLAFESGRPVGVGCLKRIRPDAAEIKRMYVMPDQRGRGTGRALLDALLDAARGEGYSDIVLDSAGFMEAAHRMYAAAGFVGTAPHPESEIPDDLKRHWVFMALRLERA